MPAALAPIAGAVVGGLMSDDQQSTASREPWAPAQPWLRENIRQGQSLQDFYQRNPFSPMQQAAYRNIFQGYDTYNNNVAPALQAIVQKYMPGYQAPQGRAESYAQPSTGLLDMRAHDDPSNPTRSAAPQAPQLDVTGVRNAPNPSVVDEYFRQNPDVAAAFTQNNYGLSRDDFARTHYDRYGRNEQRAWPGPAQYAGLLNFERDNPFRNGAVPSMADEEERLRRQQQFAAPMVSYVDQLAGGGAS